MQASIGFALQTDVSYDEEPSPIPQFGMGFSCSAKISKRLAAYQVILQAVLV
jgi:hypothetical protein